MVKKASQQIKRFQNPGGASISTVSRPVFQQDGLYFKDIDGTGALTPVNDWRLPGSAAGSSLRQDPDRKGEDRPAVHLGLAHGPQVSFGPAQRPSPGGR